MKSIKMEINNVNIINNYQNENFFYSHSVCQLWSLVKNLNINVTIKERYVKYSKLPYMNRRTIFMIRKQFIHKYLRIKLLKHGKMKKGICQTYKQSVTNCFQDRYIGRCNSSKVWSTINSKWVWPGNAENTHYRPTQGTMSKEQRTII